MPADIFISYSRKDQDFVFQLNADLERRGISSFVDQSGIIAGDVWRRQIVDAIEACRVFLLVLSPNSTISENVIKELSIAESKRKRILPILYQPVEIPVGMEYQLAGLQYQAFDRGDYSKNFSRLLDAISRLGIQLHTEKIERVPLPPELQSAIESPLSSVREGVVRELDRLLNGSIPGLALSAHEELKQLVDDDSRRVANAATQVLEAYSAKSKAKMDVASQERLTREKAEAERVARERAEAQHLAAQRAEAERASNEKAEQERLAREHAEAERVARQKAEQERLAVITPRKFIKERPERRNLWGWALFGIGFSTLSYRLD
ncbi:MAG: TIR domain-containing protein [Chloroflexi bacterium]|nr:TIR domain-containing protein [Chloroflexota bacterium]